MRQGMVMVAAASSLGLALACGGMTAPTGGNHANVEACKKYVQAFNDATCNAVDFNVEELCPQSLDLSPCNMAPYYTCMASAVKCNGDFVDIGGQANCSMPDCN
jgi:hypothetical protein